MAMHLFANLTLENFEPRWFWVLVIVLALTVVVLTYARIYRRTGRRLTWTLMALRVLGVTALLVALVKPVWQDAVEQYDAPQMAVILDDSHSMSLPHPDGDDGQADEWTPRYTQALRWLRESEAGQQLQRDFTVRLFDMAGHAIELNETPESPTGEQTDLVRSLRSAAQHMRGQHTAGVILLSDGRDTTGRDRFIALQDYPLPIHTVSFRQPTTPQGSAVDVALTAVEAPSRTLLHNTVPVRVTLQKDGGEAVTVPVHLQRSGETLMSETVALPEGAARTQATLNYTPTEPGLFTFTTRASPPGGDRTATNNTQMFRLRVDAEPIRVLYLEGVLRLEAKFLRDRLEADPDVDLINFTRAANPQRAGAANALVSGDLIDAERLEEIDVVLLGDFESRMLDTQTYHTLRDWVETGGGLMVLGGYHNLGSAGLHDTALDDVLPLRLEDGSVHQIDEAFAFTLAEAGVRHPALTVTGDHVRDAQLWAALPTLQGIVAVPHERPGATVLARHPRPNPTDDHGRGYPVLAVQRFGEGVSAMLTADTTWRWSRLTRLAGQPDTLYVRFWSQMVRWLAQREDLTAQTALTVSTDAASYERGRRVRITVQRNPAAAIPGSREAETVLQLGVQRPDGRRTTLDVQSTPSDPNRWTASYFPDRGGRYQLEASLKQQSEESSANLANQKAAFLVEGSDLELNDPAPNPTAMRQLARLTGGLHAEIDQDDATAQLVASLPVEPRMTQHVQRSAVWHSPGLFVAFLVLLCTEWIIRRQNQLV